VSSTNTENVNGQIQVVTEIDDQFQTVDSMMNYDRMMNTSPFHYSKL
jgi:hypothetical protein